MKLITAIKFWLEQKSAWFDGKFGWFFKNGQK